MNQKPKWVIFDVGGVFYNSDEFLRVLANYLRVEEKILNEQFGKLVDDSMEGQMSESEFWKNLLKIFKLEHKFESVMSLWLDESRLIKTTAVLMNNLHKAGYQIAILTNNWREMTDALYKDLSPYADIKFIFESAIEKIRKPDKRIYKVVEKKTNAKAGEIFFIDDRKKNLETAKKMGWQTFLYELGTDNGKASNDLIRKQLL